MKMLKYNYLLVLLVLLCFSCEKEIDLVEEENLFPSSTEVTMLQLEGAISSYYEMPKWSRIVPRATVKLVYDGIVLDEVAASVLGTFSFEEQPIPLDQTFIHVKAPDYFPTIRKVVEDELGSTARIHMIPRSYSAIEGHAIASDKQMIRITGNIVDGDKGGLVYVLNENDELIGNTSIDPNNPNLLDVSVVKGEKIKLYVRYPYCMAPMPMEFGQFGQDEDIGDILFEDLMQEGSLAFNGAVVNCDGIEARGRIYAFQEDRLVGLTTMSGNNTYHGFLHTCSLSASPVSVIAVYVNDDTFEFYNYGKVNTSIIQGQDVVTNIEECNPNTTNFAFGLNGAPFFVETSMTIASIRQSGDTDIFVDDINGSNDYRMTFSGSDVGLHMGSVALIQNFEVAAYGDQITFNIVSNDGEMIAGRFEGEVMDENYNSIGNVEGTFTALIK